MSQQSLLNRNTSPFNKNDQLSSEKDRELSSSNNDNMPLQVH